MHAAIRGCSQPARRCAAPRRDWRSMRSASVLTPRNARNCRTAPESRRRRFAGTPCARAAGVLAHDHDAADHVGVAVEIFGGRVHDQIEAVVRAAAASRDSRKCCRTAVRMPLGAATAATRSRSMIFSVGLVGVSSQIRRVFRPHRRLERLGIGKIDISRLDAGRLPAHQIEKPAACRRKRRRRRQCGVFFEQSSTVAVAAMPEAKAKPALPPSRSAMQRSNAMRVGFWLRAYSKPCGRPGSTAQKWMSRRSASSPRRSSGRALAGVDAAGREAEAYCWVSSCSISQCENN